MVYGNGLLAKAFEKYRLDNQIIIYATSDKSYVINNQLWNYFFNGEKKILQVLLRNNLKNLFSRFIFKTTFTPI
jgi:hypothetical protein